MKVQSEVVVTEDDGSEFARFSSVYSNVPRSVYEFMEGDVLDMLKRWNEASKQVTSGGVKPK